MKKIIIAVIVVLVALAFLYISSMRTYISFTVSNANLEPTFKNGSTLSFRKMHANETLGRDTFVLAHLLAPPDRNEPLRRTYDDQTSLVRIIGIPGDSIELKKGLVYRNGEKLIFGEKVQAEMQITPVSFASVVIPEGMYYFFEDYNPRAGSHVAGLIDYSHIVGLYVRCVEKCN